MKKHYLKTGSKKVMSAVLLAAAMMVGLAACGGNTEEAKQPESSVVESSVQESTVERSEETAEESVEESTAESGKEDTTEASDAADSVNGAAEVRTYMLEIDGVETEFEETLFRNEDGLSIWYRADLLETAEIDGYNGFLHLGEEGTEAVSFMIVPSDAALDMDEMLTEAANGFAEEEQYTDVTIGEIMTLEMDADSAVTVKSIEVVHDDTADRFYAVKDGENAVLITVKADAEVMEELGVHFDRMVSTVEFGEAEMEISGTEETEISGTEEMEISGTEEMEISGTE